MTGARDDVFHVAVHSARPVLLLRPLYLLLTADLWLGMIEHGARYGMGNFNVAHFAWLDRILPVPTPALYVGLLIASGALSSLLVWGPASVMLRLLLAGTYTFSWILSIHDSYQHHYLLSWLLVWLAACPTPRRADIRADNPVKGWGVPMTAITCAIVYTFTGISKSEPEWRSGYVLRALSGSMSKGRGGAGKLDGPRDLLMSLGLDESGAFQLLSLATIALQWTIALGYLAAPRRDASPSRLRTCLVTLGLVGALSFHAMAEVFELFEIGMFSYYMIWIALVLLGSARILTPVAKLVAGALETISATLSLSDTVLLRRSVSVAILSAAMLGAVGALIPLPGALAATLSIAAVVILCTLLAGREAAAFHQAMARAALLTTVALWIALTQTTVPFDYYRRGAGELSRMGRLQEALEMYRKAERHAPPGESRIDRIRELESTIRNGQNASP